MLYLPQENKNRTELNRVCETPETGRMLQANKVLFRKARILKKGLK